MLLCLIFHPEYSIIYNAIVNPFWPIIAFPIIDARKIDSICQKKRHESQHISAA